jgi:ribosomal protein S18 acetylase RimI-like enzyme
MKEGYVLVERNPTLEEYQKLCRVVGWGEGDIEPKAIETGLQNSLFSVCVILGDKVIGFGRIIGDGGIYFYIQGIIVSPEFQRKGIGGRIMGAIMEYLTVHAPDGAFIGLMAAKGVSKFYKVYGFKKRPSDAPGMFRVLRKTEKRIH